MILHANTNILTHVRMNAYVQLTNEKNQLHKEENFFNRKSGVRGLPENVEAGERERERWGFERRESWLSKRNPKL